MPPAKIVYYKDNDNSVPFLDWLDTIPAKAKIKCLAKLIWLEHLGHLARRPTADYLRDEIYELRIGFQGINYRVLYFFYGKTMIVVSHGIIKEQRVPPPEIDRAIMRKARFYQAPEKHFHEE